MVIPEPYTLMACKSFFIALHIASNHLKVLQVLSKKKPSLSSMFVKQDTLLLLRF